MEAKIIRDGEFIEVKTIVIRIKNSDAEYRISEGTFGGLVINKYGSEESSINITHHVSNEIKLIKYKLVRN